MNRRDNSNTKVEIIQYNIARLTLVMHTCLELIYKAKIDFILIQEPWIVEDNIGTVLYPAYIAILSRGKRTSGLE